MKNNLFFSIATSRLIVGFMLSPSTLTCCFDFGGIMYLLVILFSCGFGLQPLHELEYEENVLIGADEKSNEENEVSSFETGVFEEESIDDENEIEDVDTDEKMEDIFESDEDPIDPETEVYEHADVDGDGFSIAEGDCEDEDDTIFPGNPDLSGDGIDQDCDGVDDNNDPTSCIYNMRMFCGNDGWQNIWLQAEGGGVSLSKQPVYCNFVTQSWSSTDSESFEVEVEPGEMISLRLCHDPSCSSFLSPSSQIGLVVKVNETLIEQTTSLNSSWNFTHSCPN